MQQIFNILKLTFKMPACYILPKYSMTALCSRLGSNKAGKGEKLTGAMKRTLCPQLQVKIFENEDNGGADDSSILHLTLKTRGTW